MTRRRVSPVELFVGAGVLAAAWGLVGSWIALGGLPLAFWLAARILMRSKTRAMLPAYCLALLPAATLGALYVLHTTRTLKPADLSGCCRMGRSYVQFSIGLAFVTALIHALGCFVLHARDCFRGESSRWLVCGIFTLGCLCSSLLLLWLDPGRRLAELWWW